MERVLGIGGYFIRSADPTALAAWYRESLGLDTDANGLWGQEVGPMVFATFASSTDYFGSHAQQAMINLRVRDLDAMLEQLRGKGADVATETQELEGVGRLGGSLIPRATASSYGSPPDGGFTQAARC